MLMETDEYGALLKVMEEGGGGGLNINLISRKLKLCLDLKQQRCMDF